MKRVFFLLIVFAVLISACGPRVELAKSDLRRETKPQVSDANLEALVSGNNTFALDLYQLLSTNEGNLVISPYSVSIAFAMTYAGARGDTASQIASTLHFGLPEDQLHDAFNALDLALAKDAKAKVPKDRDPMQLNIANAIWAQKNFSFQEPFLNALGRNYGAGIRLVDFGSNPNAVRNAVNAWADRETKGQIKDVVPEGGFDQSTRLVLINAIYFEANWQEPFSPAGRGLPFNLLDGSQIYVPAMELREEYLPYAANESWLAIELPYAGETCAMVIIVPSVGEFDEFQTDMDYQLISGVISSLQKTFVTVTMPKFEFTSDLALAAQLQSLGISDAFNASAFLGYDRATRSLS